MREYSQIYFFVLFYVNYWMWKRSYTSLYIRSIDLKTKKEIKKEKDLYELPLL